MSQTIYHLELKSLRDLRAARPQPALRVETIPPKPSLNARLYREVGADWQWRDRLPWTTQQWADWVDRPEITTQVATLSNGEEVGYTELEQQGEGEVELVYFGLKKPYLGRGLGGAFLTRVVAEAWKREGLHRLWLHTCSEDHANALTNYQARGFEIFKIEEDQPSSGGEPAP